MKLHPLFLHSEVPNPFPYYQEQLQRNPVYWDEEAGLWVVYSYDACRFCLHHPSLVIPPSNNQLVEEPALNFFLTGIKKQFARLSNPPQHASAREHAFSLFQCMKPPASVQLMEHLLRNPVVERPFDWVGTVASRYFPLSILLGMGFNVDVAVRIATHMPVLKKIMLPNISIEEASQIKNVVEEIVATLHQQQIRLSGSSGLSQPSASPQAGSNYLAANLIGLLVQSIDGGRAVLTNSLIHLYENGFKHLSPKPSQQYWSEFVRESIRINPPFHHTRRKLAETVMLNGHVLESNQEILIVLAAANWDPNYFIHPDQFDMARPVKNEFTSFGWGIHHCLADRWVVSEVANVMQWIFENHPRLKIASEAASFEPLSNVRLRKQLLVEL